MATSDIVTKNSVYIFGIVREKEDTFFNIKIMKNAFLEGLAYS